MVTRYSSGHMPANRLYFGTGRMYVRDQGFCRMGDEGDGWTRVEPYHLALVTPELSVSTGSDRGGLNRVRVQTER